MRRVAGQATAASSGRTDRRRDTPPSKFAQPAQTLAPARKSVPEASVWRVRASPIPNRWRAAVEGHLVIAWKLTNASTTARHSCGPRGTANTPPTTPPLHRVHRVIDFGPLSVRSTEKDQVLDAPRAQARDSELIATISPISTTGTTLTSFQYTNFETNEATTLGSSASTRT
jgi:hypothetical protein